MTLETQPLDTKNMSATERKVAQRLLEQGLLSLEAIEKAMAEQRETGAHLGMCLVSLGLINENELTRLYGQQFGVPAVDLSKVEVDTKVLNLIPADFANKHLVLPLRRVGRTLTVAMADPTNLNVVDDLKFITRFDIEPVVGGEYSLRSMIDRHYEVVSEQLGSLLEELEEQDVEVVSEGDDEEYSTALLRAQVEEEPIVKLINGILGDALRRGASDIHVEPYEHELRVRYRVDGALQEIMQPPRRMTAALTSRFKILADLNIAEHRRAADPAGRPDQDEDREARDRLSCVDAPDPVRREDRAPHPRQGDAAAGPRGVRDGAGRGAGVPRRDLEPVRDGPGHRSHRLG
jgi:type IV pilus assembly protein PilB